MNLTKATEVVNEAADILRDDNARVTTARGVSMTEYRVKGSLSSILDFIARLMGEKHPAGYGTRVHSIEWDYSGAYVARISHSNSAD